MNNPACAESSLRVQVGLCTRGFQPRNPKNTANRAALQNTKSNILTCFKTYNYTNLDYTNILKHKTSKETNKNRIKLKKIKEKRDRKSVV